MVFYQKILGLGSLLIVFASSGVALSGEKDETPTYSSVLYSESGYARKDQDHYSTLITAFNSDLDKDGFLFRVEGSLDKFKYDARLDAAVTRIDGTDWQGGAFIGYQLIRQDINFSAYAGVDYQSISLSSFTLIIQFAASGRDSK